MGYFDVPQRGDERAAMLAQYRGGLRLLVNPDTRAPFTDEEIARATQEGTRDYAELDALDLMLIAQHAKAAALADQAIPSRATTGTLRGLLAPLREVTPLTATGATLKATAQAPAGSVFVGSTTIPDPAAAQATDTASGLRFQVLFTVTTPANGIAGSDPAAPLFLVGIDTGERTNLPAPAAMKWAANFPLSASVTFATTEDGSGGTNDETDGELAARIETDIGHPKESGNNAQTRAWARESSNAVEDGFVYACAKYAGSMLVCVTQKRGRQTEAAPKGPLARIPSAGTLAIARAYLVPPASPVVPERAVSFVVAPTSEGVNMVLALALPRGRGLGWNDVRPWPRYNSGPATISAVADQQHFTIASAIPLPSASIVPAIMAWNRSKSRWEKLNVQSITAGAPGFFSVVLASPPSTMTLAVGQFISPALKGLVPLAQGVERYFDSLGPGEVIDLTTDVRAPRAQRFPDPVEQYPQRAGSAIISVLQAALVGTITSGEVLEQSATTPTVPADPTLGPYMLTCGNIAVYPLDA